jgi:hypothetical protein
MTMLNNQGLYNVMDISMEIERPGSSRIMEGYITVKSH